MSRSLSDAARRMHETLVRMSAREVQRHPDSGGWVEPWNVFDAWGHEQPLGLMVANSGKVFQALYRAGLVEDHPETPDLIRPRAEVK